MEKFAEPDATLACPNCGKEISTCRCEPQQAPPPAADTVATKPTAPQDTCLSDTEIDIDEKIIKPANEALQKSASGSDPMIGKVLGGAYQLLERLGSGGMSVVYKARHLHLAKDVVVKLVSHERLVDQKTIGRFAREAKAAALLSHPNIVNTREFGLAEDGHPFIVMDLADGKPLSRIIEEEGTLAPEKAVMIASQVCEGLAHAHSKGVIHRDVKPSNIMISHDRSGKLIAQVADFGIAKISDDDGGSDLTKTGDVFGSPLYMSPEQCRGKKVDAQSDIYSFGCVLFEMLTGEPPFKGDSALGTLMLHVGEEAPEFKTGISADLERITLKALEKNPQKRYQSFDQLLSELDAADLGSGKRKPKRRKRQRFALRTRIAAYVSICAVACAAAVSAAFIDRWKQDQWRESMRAAQYFYFQDNKLQMDREFKKALEQAPDFDAQAQVHQTEGHMYLTVWQTTHSDEDWHKAWNEYESMLKAGKEAGKPFFQAHANEALGDMCTTAKDYKNAEQFYLRALDFRKQSPGDKNWFVAVTEYRLAETYIALHKNELAAKYLDDLLKITKDVDTEDSRTALPGALEMFAENARDTNKLQEAAKYYDEAIAAESKLPHPNAGYIERLKEARAKLDAKPH